ncbi:hypothetical protein SEA_NERGAL_79 [Mycobacterium Phage Nergal]|nr:hypothetical protein SEA_NERGAL_79 [Mycobacterium Phage Nergal]
MPTLDVQVFVPRGPVQRNKVLQAALAKVRDTLPPTLTCDARITGADKRPDDHDKPGTEYTVTIDYTERGTGAQGNASTLPAGTFGYSQVVDDDDADIDGVEKALDAMSTDTAAAVAALNAQGVKA